ncbi:MAG: glycoside hydrolase family 92 protein, partial [Opitutales bacterium]|nr:glycoside hydrolase family 92 protein [Opitutales bacterium]
KNCGVWEVKYPKELSGKRNVDSHQKIEFYELAANAEVRPLEKSARGEHLGFFTEFETAEKEKVLMKAGVSFVSMKNAEENLKGDIPDWNFERVRKKARKLWADAVSKMSVEGATEKDKTIFYTALYHALIDPRLASDKNGQYMGADGEIHTAKGFNYRTIFSGWDVFRSEFPLLTIIRPDVVNDEINTLIQLAELSPANKGFLPRWEIMNSYSRCMLGDPAISVICDAYAKGIRNFDAEKAFEFAKNTSLKRDGNNFNFHKFGYCPEHVSHTLEIAYGAWCVGRLAEMLGKNPDAEFFYKASKNYKNIYDPDVKWFRAKNGDGSWKKFYKKENGAEVELAFDKTRHNQGCVESNNFQQGWFVPHDIEGLKNLLGEGYFLSELERFFDNTPEDFMWNDYYNHPNEPNHQAPFMFNYTSKPCLTQKWTRKICEKAYGDGVMGLVGNDDVGQTSAWYVLAASGIHPVCPGSTRYEITSPVFDKITIRTDPKFYSGKTFEIVAYNNSKSNVYIRAAKLNGEPLNRLFIDHSEIVKGGRLELFMSDTPNESLGVLK